MNQAQYIEEDEIDLRELFATIWRYKIFIALFTAVVTMFTIVITTSKPNIYQSEIQLIPQNEQGGGSLGGLGALAGFAGVDIGGSEVSASSSMSLVLSNYSFNLKLIEKYGLTDKLKSQENYVYPFGLEFQIERYDKDIEEVELRFIIYQELQKILSITEDKKSGVITLSAKLEDRFLAKELVDIYLFEITSYLRTLDMKDMDKQIEFYQDELSRTTNIELQQQLSQLLAQLFQKKVLAKASEFYIVKKMSNSEVAYIKDKVGPKRALIVVVAFVTSIILAIFIIFFREFLRGENSE
jgi:uncharacterized protein involved in exopolysaccharide biosynthesis